MSRPVTIHVTARELSYSKHDKVGAVRAILAGQGIPMGPNLRRLDVAHGRLVVLKDGRGGRRYTWMA